MKLTGNNLVIVNILATYVRIVLVAGMGLFSVRWILQALGSEDFGLYSVVGGLIIFILFIGNTMASSVQRFYAYAIGQGDPEEVKKWFTCAFSLHATFALGFVLIGVPLGIYLIGNVMQIPLERMRVCHWIYYLSIVGGTSTILSTPFLGMFYARQRIFETTFWQSLQALGLFVFTFYLLRLPGDLLLIYALGMVAIKLTFDATQVFRALSIFDDCQFQSSYFFHKKRAQELMYFAGWRFFGEIGTTLKNQGINFLINLFFGSKVNAAYAVGNQVGAQAEGITGALINAISPEITTREGANQRERMLSLSLRTSKFAILLTFLWLIPLYIEIDYILQLWLPQVPEYTAAFCRIILVAYLIEKGSIGYLSAIAAYGKIAGFQATMGGLRILTFPLVLIGLLLGWKVDTALLMMILTSAGICIGRVLWMKKLMQVPVSKWVSFVFLKTFYVLIPTIIVGVLLDIILSISLQRLFFMILICDFCVISGSWFFAFDKTEKNFIVLKLRKIIEFYVKK